jgi:hypothetical protein
MSDMLIAIGERHGKVVFSFPHPTNEFVCDAENARQISEQIARSAHKAHTGSEWPSTRSAVSEALRKRMRARAAIVVRTLMEQGKSADYIGKHLVDIILTEIV